MIRAESGGTLGDMDRIAHTFGVTKKAVRDWISLGMPVKRVGRQGRGHKTQICVIEAARWWFNENFERLELERARTRLANEQADKQALDNSQRRADLAPISMIKREFGALLTAIRANALAMSSKLAPELEGLSIEARKAAIDRTVFDFLDRAAAWDPPSEPGRRVR